MKNNKSNWNIVAAFVAISIFIVTVITAFSAVLTLAVNQVHAQLMNITEQKSYVTDVNVHFKTACIYIIVFTYCW